MDRWCDEIYESVKIVDEIKRGFVKKDKFEISSRDQGWGVEELLSWVEAGVINLDEKEISSRIKLMDNPRKRGMDDDKKELLIEFGDSKYQSFLNALEPGNKIVIWARCATPGWKCCIDFFSLKILYISNK